MRRSNFSVQILILLALTPHIQRGIHVSRKQVPELSGPQHPTPISPFRLTEPKGEIWSALYALKELILMFGYRGLTEIDEILGYGVMPLCPDRLSVVIEDPIYRVTLSEMQPAILSYFRAGI